jgi:general secretion pathway protein G
VKLLGSRFEVRGSREKPRTGRLEARISNCGPDAGLTLVELIITVAIVGILATAALPIARFQVKREKERELRRDLWEMRDAIDAYKDAADKHAFQTKVDTQNYPPDLETLVKGEDVQGKKLKFLRRIPVDPMTGKAEWGLRSMQDDSDSTSYGGQSVFDVYSKSDKTALDGTKYSTW